MNIKFEFFRVAPVLLTTVAVLSALLFQSVEWAMLVAGLFINGLLWGIINPIIKERYPAIAKRPSKSQCYFFHQKTLTDAGGMPSGHSQSAAFFSTWIILMALRHQLPTPAVVIVFAIALWLTVGMMISRVHEYRCHTQLQAAIGSTIGIVTALILWPLTSWLF
jgi:acid phosphatase family membrane protein YuiD